MKLSPLIDQRIADLQRACEHSYMKRYAGVIATGHPMNEDYRECTRLNGRKYIKLIYPQGSVFAFIDKDGNVYKPASWASPQRDVCGVPDVRYRLQDDSSYNEAIKRCDWAGGFLYK